MTGRDTHASVIWDAQQRLVVITFRSFTSGERYRDAMRRGLDLAVARRADTCLCDVSRMGVTTSEDLTWWNESWLPEARDSTLSRVAIISPNMPLARVGAERVLHDDGADGEAPHRLRVRYFEARQAGLRWLADARAMGTPLHIAA